LKLGFLRVKGALFCALLFTSCFAPLRQESTDVTREFIAGNATTSSGGVLIVFNQFNGVATGNYIRYAVVVPTLMRLHGVSEEQAAEIAKRCITLPDHPVLKYLVQAVSYRDRLDLYFGESLDRVSRVLRVPFQCVVSQAELIASRVCQLPTPEASYLSADQRVITVSPSSPRSTRVLGQAPGDRMSTLLTLLQHALTSEAHTFTPLFLSSHSPILQSALAAPKQKGGSLDDYAIELPSGGFTDSLLNSLEEIYFQNPTRQAFVQQLSSALQALPTASAAADADLSGALGGPTDPTRFFMLSGTVPGLRFPVYKLQASGEMFTCQFGRKGGARSLLQVFAYENLYGGVAFAPDIAQLHSIFFQRGEDAMNPAFLNSQMEWVDRGYFRGARAAGLDSQYWERFPGVYFSAVSYINALARDVTYSVALVDEYAEQVARFSTGSTR
jgi:hypothetical protein